MNLILIGPPGSGKGTQARLLEKEFGVTHVSTGDILRSAVAEGSALGHQVKQLMTTGQLVPDDVMVELVRSRLRNGVSGGILLDGFPRTVEQAEALDRILGETGEQIDHVVSINVGRNELVRRLLRRGHVEGRSDDSEAVIDARLEVYKRETLPLVDWYRRRSVVVEVDGERGIEEVHAAIRARLNSDAP